MLSERWLSHFGFWWTEAEADEGDSRVRGGDWSSAAVVLVAVSPAACDAAGDEAAVVGWVMGGTVSLS